MPPNAFYECGTCDRCFPAGWRARENHCQSTGHSPPALECDSCHRWFWTEHARRQHMRDTGHWGDDDDDDDDFGFDCAVCSASWPSQQACTQNGHEDHLYCAQCDRGFQTDNSLRMHLNSRVHRGQSIACPFCSRAFTSAAGLTHHLEAGSCPSAPKLDRDQLFRVVRSKDPGGIISKKLLQWASSFEYVVDSASWNGYAWECGICSREFGKIESLQQHLSSPTHQQELYHCPNASCRINFKSLAGIINHLESESCRFTKYEHVQWKIKDFVSGDRLISF